jgi:AcrR family transcriptional regulator
MMPVDRNQPIDRERLVRTALELLDEVGLANLTLRRIADRLNVKAPALYWHFKNKKELLDAMGTTVLTDAVLPLGDLSWTEDAEFAGPDGWRAFARRHSQGLRAALLKYRDGAKMVPGTYLTDTRMYAVQEAALGIFRRGGFTPELASAALQTLYSFTVGFAIEEQAMYPRPGEVDENYAPERRLRRIDPEIAPTVAELAAADHIRAGDRNFAGGVAIIIAGLESVLAQGIGRR